MSSYHTISRCVPSSTEVQASTNTNARASTHVKKPHHVCIRQVGTLCGRAQRRQLQCVSFRGAGRVVSRRASPTAAVAGGGEGASAETAPAAPASGSAPTELRGRALVWAVAKPPIYTVALEIGRAHV